MINASPTTNALKALKDSGDFNAFLGKALELQYAHRKVNLADFSKRAGFSSRSYLSEVLSNKKGLSLDAVSKIKSALKLPKSHLKLLELLAYQKSPSLLPPRWTPEVLQSKIKATREACSAPPIGKESIQSPSHLASRAATYQIYAALGSEHLGASFEQLLSRTHLPKEIIETSVKALLEEQVVEKRGERYYAKANSLALFGLKSNEGLAALIGEVCRDITLNRRKIIDAGDNSISYTAFSTTKDKLPAFKKRMREALTDKWDKWPFPFVCI